MTSCSSTPHLEIMSTGKYMVLFNVGRVLLMHIWELQLVHSDQTLVLGENDNQFCS